MPITEEPVQSPLSADLRAYREAVALFDSYVDPRVLVQRMGHSLRNAFQRSDGMS